MTESSDNGSHAQTRQLRRTDPLCVIRFVFFSLFTISHSATATQQPVILVIDRTFCTISLTCPILLPAFWKTMAKLNEHNPDSIRRRYSQQNRELVLENAALRRQKRLLEQQIHQLKEYVFELWRRIDCPMHFVVKESSPEEPATDIKGLVGREMEAKRRPEPILSPIPESNSSPRYSLSPGTPPVVASLPEGLETPTKTIPEQGSVNVESRRRRKDNSKAKKISVFESPPREKPNEFSSITPINWLLESTTPPSEKNQSPVKEAASFQTELGVVVKKVPKRQKMSSRTSAGDSGIPNVQPKAIGPKRRPVSTVTEMPKPKTKDALSPIRPALGTKSVNIDSPTKSSKRQNPKGKSDTLIPSMITTTTPKTIAITTSTAAKNTTRSRRASSTSVNYKEPNLVSKMRRPSATLVDAVPSSAPGSNSSCRSSISKDSGENVFDLTSEH
jgi:hypothetical protein